jgi:D-alanine--poly(phosphoribitol) ligase subunit 2
MATDTSTVDRVRLLIEDVLDIEVPDGDIDLIDSGLLDSLALVSLIAGIEEEFQLALPLEDLDVDQLRSAESIAQLLATSWR